MSTIADPAIAVHPVDESQIPYQWARDTDVYLMQAMVKRVRGGGRFGPEEGRAITSLWREARRLKREQYRPALERMRHGD